MNKIDEAEFLTYLSLENEKMLTTVGEINSLNLKEECTTEEIDDYVNVINEFNIKNECKELRSKMNEESDQNNKKQLLQRIIDLRKEN